MCHSGTKISTSSQTVMDLGVNQSDLRKCTALAHGTHHYKNQSGTTFVKCEGTKLTASGMR